jgi:hypothetical protein
MDWTADTGPRSGTRGFLCPFMSAKNLRSCHGSHSISLVREFRIRTTHTYTPGLSRSSVVSVRMLGTPLRVLAPLSGRLAEAVVGLLPTAISSLIWNRLSEPGRPFCCSNASLMKRFRTRDSNCSCGEGWCSVFCPCMWMWCR